MINDENRYKLTEEELVSGWNGFWTRWLGHFTANQLLVEEKARKSQQQPNHCLEGVEDKARADAFVKRVKKYRKNGYSEKRLDFGLKGVN